MGRSQQGNNNAYCQDNELSWLNWDLQVGNADLLKFTSQLIYFRREHPVFRRRKWFQGRAIHGSGVSDIGWFNPDGGEMTEEQWQVGYAKAIGVFLNGEEIPARGPRGERIVDDSFLLFFNGHYEMINFALPTGLDDRQWAVVIDTKEPQFATEDNLFTGSQAVPVTARSLVVLRRVG